MQQTAQNKGGKCLSQHYNSKYMEWQCKCSFKWRAPPYSISKGHWCPKCAGNAKYTITDMKLLAKQRGGQCLSNHYVNCRSKLLWQCADGHTWESEPRSIRYNKSWCPQCTFIKEEQCRFILNELTGGKFVKTRRILNGLELDGYCKELEAAFEYQGEQHFNFMPGWHKTKQGFQDLQLRDKIKTDMCINKGIAKIDIPYQESSNKELITEYIQKEAREAGIPTIGEHVNWSHFPAFRSELDALRQLARSKNGNLLSNVYEGALVPLTWVCNACKHQWKTSPANIKNGTWCPKCAKVAKCNIEDMHTIAEQRQGKCLSTEYTNDRTPLWWQCQHNHQWHATPGRIKQNRWCPTCSGKQKLSIEQMRSIALKRRGSCLSDTYINSKTSLLWECEKGHQWAARPNHVKSGSWCPACQGRNMS